MKTMLHNNQNIFKRLYQYGTLESWTFSYNTRVQNTLKFFLLKDVLNADRCILLKLQNCYHNDFRQHHFLFFTFSLSSMKKTQRCTTWFWKKFKKTRFFFLIFHLLLLDLLLFFFPWEKSCLDHISEIFLGKKLLILTKLHIWILFKISFSKSIKFLFS